MRRFWVLALVLLAGAGAAMAATLRTPLGLPLWHYHAALAILGLAAIPLWPLLRRRRVASMGMASTGILATATGFVMLYTKQFPFKEWLTWWHSAMSFAFTGFFLVHWWLNQPRLAGFTRRVAASLPKGGAVGGAWTAGVVAGALTWTPDGRTLFTSENYLLLSSWAIWWGVALTWGVWLWHRRDAWRARLADHAYRTSARALVDTSLFLSCWLALLTGFALLYFQEFLHGNGFKYVSKWWHTSTSVLLLGFVALHLGFNARVLRAHARRLDAELAGARAGQRE